MLVVKKKINDLISPAYNPRQKLAPEDAEYQRIKRSIETFGYVDPIIFNKRTMHIVGGNQRWQVLKDMGTKTVDAVEVDLDDDQEKALNVALNKISGEWNMELLREVLLELDTHGMDITLTGFELSEILPPVDDTLGEWQGMPDYQGADTTGFQAIIVHFRTQDDVRAFADLIQQTLTDKTKAIWFPPIPDDELRTKGFQ